MKNLSENIQLEIDKLTEATYSDIKKKQGTITNLFPPFYDRVDAVRVKGGIKLTKMTKDGWNFKVHSGTKDDVWYDVGVKFLGIREVMGYAAKEPGLWKTGGGGVNLSKLANWVFYNTDIQVRCDCKADLMWGKHYQRSQQDMDALIPPPENRFPIVRNPKLYGAHCKHIQLVMNLLPMYLGTFAKFLKEHYMGDITSAEKVTKKEGYREEEQEREEKSGPVVAEHGKEETSESLSEKKMYKYWLKFDPTRKNVKKVLDKGSNFTINWTASHSNMAFNIIEIESSDSYMNLDLDVNSTSSPFKRLYSCPSYTGRKQSFDSLQQIFGKYWTA